MRDDFPGAGRLRHVVTITDPNVGSPVQNTFGEDTPTAGTVGTFRALVEPLQGALQERALQRWAMAKYQITMRYQTGVTIGRDMLVEWGDKTLKILDINDTLSGYRPKTVLICRDYEG